MHTTHESHRHGNVPHSSARISFISTPENQRSDAPVSRSREILWPETPKGEGPGHLLGFSATAIVVGALTGLVTGTFKKALESVSEGRGALIEWAQHDRFLGLMAVMAVCAAGASLAAALVHRLEPHAEGSGIPRVEAVVAGRIPPGSPLILPIKYLGGLLAIGSGLALGREGPSVQMGGNIAITISRLTRRNSHDLRVLVAAGAAAGLATAFNAPIAGGVFVLEELIRRFDPRTTIATLLAAGSGFYSAKLVLGESGHDFDTALISAPTLAHAPVMLAVGVVAGLVGVAYNWLILSSLNIMDRSRLPCELRAGLIGAGIGCVAYFAPNLVGGGDSLTQHALLHGDSLALAAVAGILVARIGLGVLSYAAATPGGLFAPMLVLGSYVGLLVGIAGKAVIPQWTPEPTALALIGIAAFFTATVRAPLTGIVLATELTGVTTQLPPMLGACALAMLVATALRSEPIYDALSARSTRAAQRNATERGHRKGLS